MANKGAPKKTKTPKSGIIPNVVGDDGMIRPAWKIVPAVDGSEGMQHVFHVRPGSPIIPCPNCGERVVKIFLARGDERTSKLLEDDYTMIREHMFGPRTVERPSIPAKENPLWLEFHDQYYPQHQCNKFKAEAFLEKCLKEEFELNFRMCAVWAVIQCHIEAVTRKVELERERERYEENW